jgi:hypothetical protein
MTNMDKHLHYIQYANVFHMIISKLVFYSPFYVMDFGNQMSF